VKLIVGLGNPGKKYAGTRHNVGFEVVDRLAARWGVDLRTEKFHGFFGAGTFRGERVALVKPLTFMNRSGQAVAAVGTFYKLELDDLLVIVDDLALPVGQVRMRPRGSSGGHNGLADISRRLSTDDWCRLRVGIGEPLGDAVSWVLGRFHESELPLMATSMERAADAAECWMTDGVELSMTRFNGDDPSAQAD